MNQLLKRQEKIFTNTVKVLVDTTIENFGPKDWIFIVEKTDEVYSRIDRRVFMIQRADKFIVESTEHKLRNNFFSFLKIFKKKTSKNRAERRKQMHWKKREKKSARVEVENFAKVDSESEEPRPCLKQFNHGIMGLTDWRSHLKMRIILGMILLGSWFSKFLIQNVPGMAQEFARIFGLKVIPSDSNRATKMRHSVLLNSWDSFSVALPSMPSETCMMSSSFPATDVFVDWLFLGNSFCVSLATAANFRLFLNVVIFSKRKS